jgi:hypothetical protein
MGEPKFQVIEDGDEWLVELGDGWVATVPAHKPAARLSRLLTEGEEMREVLRALPKCPLCGEPADNGVCTPDCRLARLIGGADA